MHTNGSGNWFRNHKKSNIPTVITMHTVFTLSKA